MNTAAQSCDHRLEVFTPLSFLVAVLILDSYVEMVDATNGTDSAVYRIERPFSRHSLMVHMSTRFSSSSAIASSRLSIPFSGTNMPLEKTRHITL